MTTNIATFNVTDQLRKLKVNAHLSNGVSRQALSDAVKLWARHTSRYDYQRDAESLRAVRCEISMIISQVKQRLCRINPVMWSELHKLDTALAVAYHHGINLEPNPMPEAANDGHNIDEVSNG